MTQNLAIATHRPSFVVRLFQPLGRAWLWLTGWRIEGELPELAKFIIIGAPHTSNWDFPHMLAASLHYGAHFHWMGKTSIFKWPFGGLMRWLGGIPVDRSQSTNAVAQMIEVFDKADRLTVVIAPEGTRGQVTKWKSGFYHIAVGAKVPIVLGFIDHKRKRTGIDRVFHPTGDYAADLAAIQAVYAPLMPERGASAKT